MQRTKDPLIFIVQVNVIYKDLIVGYLKQRKFVNVKTFASGEECLKSIPLKPDIIVTDYSFDEMSGLDLMKMIKPEHPEIDFIFLSGQNNLEVAVKLMKLGAADYIVKNPEAPQNLVHSIEFILSSGKVKEVRKGFKIGVVGFFVMLFLIIMIIVLLTILLEDYSLT